MAGLKLAKPHIDVGLATNRSDDMFAFWQEEVGLPFDHYLPLGGGVRQHRHDMNGSVLKINQARNPLPDTPPSGYRHLTIAREGLTGPRDLSDPDGNPVRLVPTGTDGIVGIGLRLGVRDVAAHHHFYSSILGLEEAPEAGANAVRCGDSIIQFEEDKNAPADASMEGSGYRYCTIQIWDVDGDHAAILAAGGAEGRPPVTLGTTARISFIRDPDGNWIELSQRASLTGALE